MEKKQIEKLLSEKLASLGFDLASFEISFSKNEQVVSIVVDRVENIDMEAITKLSQELSLFFDEIDPFDRAYTLDISSLGAEKPLKVEDLSKYLNSYVNVHLINPIDGENIYEGDLVDVKEEKITLSYHIKTRVKTVDITKSNISKIRLAIKF